MYYLAKKEYDYAIRICAFLAGSKEKRHQTIQNLSSILLVSKPFATKIIYQLKKSDIVKTTRGKKGGVQLAVQPSDLSFFQIFEALGLGRNISECIKNDKFCPLPAPCNIHQYFIDQEIKIIKELKKTTISKFAFSTDNIK